MAQTVRAAALGMLKAGRPGGPGWYVDYPSAPKPKCVWKLVGPFPTRLEAEAFNALIHPGPAPQAAPSGVYEYTAEELEHGKAHAAEVGYSELRLLDVADPKAVNVPVKLWGPEHFRMGVTPALVEEALKRAAEAPAVCADRRAREKAALAGPQAA